MSTRLPHAETRGLWLGLLGVVIFAATLPMTRLAVGSADAPQLSGLFVASGRACVAALLALYFLRASGARWPLRQEWLPLAGVTLGVVIGFPMLTSVAMRHVQAVHASVMLGVLPLATALVGAWLQRQRPSLGFWLCAGTGAALVVGFALHRAGPSGQVDGWNLAWADGLLLGAMLCAAVGYGLGSRLAQRLRADHVIGWALLLGLPINLPLALMQWPHGTITLGAWSGFAYVAVGSQWLGFLAWYRGLALGGTVRVSQVQLLQPFLSMLLAVPLLGEQLDAVSVGFGLAVMAVVLASRAMPVRQVPSLTTSTIQP
jgi:drug/metabolite transporter (DMT)-like permease